MFGFDFCKLEAKIVLLLLSVALLWLINLVLAQTIPSLCLNMRFSPMVCQVFHELLERAFTNLFEWLAIPEDEANLLERGWRGWQRF